MKKFTFLAIFIFMCTISVAQNIQVHYDFGGNIYKGQGNRPTITTTAEMFRADKFGSTFFFVDLDYSPKVTGAYWEIARELCFWQNSKLDWLSVHVEYNGGCSTVAGSFNNSWLAGLTYSGHSKDYSKTWSLSAMYKLIPGTPAPIGNSSNYQIHNFQITGVWGIDFANGWLTNSGFIDFWREYRPWQDTSYILLSEIQLWVNLNKIKGWKNIPLSVGGEVELSNNFVDRGFYAIPTLAAKWTF